ncbi:MAG: hypothetical protein KAQ75_15105 [Bacteroidales bacterium]|nr:hypothetical protein [Bacteroidales bacterium]
MKKETLLIMLIIFSGLFVLLLGCGREKLQLKKETEYMDKILQMQNQEGAFVYRPASDTIISSKIISILNSVKMDSLPVCTEKYLMFLYNRERKWKKIIWQKAEANNLPDEISGHYLILANTLTGFDMKDVQKKGLLKEQVNKLISEQVVNGSWYDIFLITADNVKMLNKYYKLSKEESVLAAIKKANLWMNGQLSTAEGVGTYTEIDYILHCFYAKSLVDAPSDILEDHNVIKTIKKMERYYYLRDSREIKDINDPIEPAYCSDITGWFCYFLLTCPAVEEDVKTHLKEKISAYLLNNQKSSGYWLDEAGILPKDNNQIAIAVNILNALISLMPDLEEKITGSKDKAVSYLLSVQHDDGGWSDGVKEKELIDVTILNTINLLKLYKLTAIENYLTAAEKALVWLSDNYQKEKTLYESQYSRFGGAEVYSMYNYFDGLLSGLLPLISNLPNSQTAYQSISGYIYKQMESYENNDSSLNNSSQEIIMHLNALSMASGLYEADKDKFNNSSLLLKTKNTFTQILDLQSENGQWKRAMGAGNEIDITSYVCFVMKKTADTFDYDINRQLIKGINYILSKIPVEDSLDNFMESGIFPVPENTLVYTYILLNSFDEFKEKKYDIYRSTIKSWLESLIDRDFETGNPYVSFKLYGFYFPCTIDTPV